MKQKSVGKLIFQSLLILVLLFGLARIVITGSGPFAVVELVALLILLLLSVVGLATYTKAGKKILFLVFLLYTVNVLLLWYTNNSLYPVLLVASLVGVWVSMPCRSRKSCVEECGSQCEPMPSAPPQKVVDGKVAPKSAEVKVEPKETTAPVKAKFTPGKYVASKRSNVYHEPKCDWAKKIQKSRQVWFASREEALNKGYKKHSCVN